jgi:hypothetical protein
MQVYGIGLGKSGTHSLAALFSRTVRSGHEATAGPLIDRIIGWKQGALSEAEIRSWLHDRDRELALEVDSSGLNFHVVDLLVNEFPSAKFVLTIRDCYSWTNSMLKHLVRFPTEKIPSHWARMRAFNLENEPPVYAPEEENLRQEGLDSASRLLSQWAKRNALAIEKIPAERLFVVRTDQLKQRAFEIADFVGLHRRLVRPERAHEFQNPSKRMPLLELDPQFVERAAMKYCRPLMNQFFPEIRSVADALPSMPSRA